MRRREGRLAESPRTGEYGLNKHVCDSHLVCNRWTGGPLSLWSLEDIAS